MTMRVIKHLMMTPWRVKSAFPQNALLAIESAIGATEALHSGQVRFAVEGALDLLPLLKGQTAAERAVEVFSQLRIWDTEHNNGLLIYLLLADSAVEIVADRGIHRKVGTEEWQAICCTMETSFKQGHFDSGVIAGIHAVTERLAQHFPARGEKYNELSDEAIIL